MRITFIILLLLIKGVIYSQNTPYNLINSCLIYDDYNCGISITDTNKLVIIKLTTNSYKDSSIVQFNKSGQIVKTITKFEKCSYKYLDNTIIKEVKRIYPPRYTDCYAYTVTYYLSDDIINYKELECEGNLISYAYDYSQCNNVTSVKILKPNKSVVSTEVFVYDEKKNFLWETLNSFGGFTLNYYSSEKIQEYTSNLFHDTSILYGIIKHQTKIGNQWKQLPNKYTIFDTRGSVYGELEILRVPPPAREGL